MQVQALHLELKVNIGPLGAIQVAFFLHHFAQGPLHLFLLRFKVLLANIFPFGIHSFFAIRGRVKVSAGILALPVIALDVEILPIEIHDLLRLVDLRPV
mmetsp:Transcript_4865/g.6451  ORF Transcript_4865/g.6451 Transcript_4865/m.6451 type:complete len:99 (-) Transcript_4865:144-440(-)